MHNNNQLINMARELLEIEGDLVYRAKFSNNYIRLNRDDIIDDFDLYTFVQTWESTSLGFGGIGGCAMTDARTYVFVPRELSSKCVVYFGNKFAYTADYSEAFKEDLVLGSMAPVYEANKYNLKE